MKYNDNHLYDSHKLNDVHAINIIDPSQQRHQQHQRTQTDLKQQQVNHSMFNVREGKSSQNVLTKIVQQTKHPRNKINVDTHNLLLNQIYNAEGHNIRSLAYSYWELFEQQGDVAFADVNHRQQDSSLLCFLEKLCLMLVFFDEQQFRDLFALVQATKQHINNSVKLSTDNMNVSLPSVNHIVISLKAMTGTTNNFLDHVVKSLNFSQFDYEGAFRRLRGIFSLWLWYQQDLEIYHKLPQCLRCPPHPYLPEIASNALILVVDLDETLVHYKRGDVKNVLHVRHYARQFLETLSGRYTIVIWTASMPRYARWALKKIGAAIPLKLLTRQHCHLRGDRSSLVKPLWRIGEQCVRRCLLIENEIRSAADSEKANCLLVEPYLGGAPDDTTLESLCSYLVGVSLAYKPSQSITSCLK